MDDEVTSYTLDLNSGLTQVLTDGNTHYLYGLGRIAELQPAGWQVHLSDALGSVRQLVDIKNNITHTQTFTPFGSPRNTTGELTSNYGFTGEWKDATRLVHLRALYLDTNAGRFTQVDPWGGSVQQPMSFNPYLYGYNNPIRYTDPSGQCVLTYYTAGTLFLETIIIDAVCWVIVIGAMGTMSIHAPDSMRNSAPDVARMLENWTNACETAVGYITDTMTEHQNKTWQYLLNHVAPAPDPEQKPKHTPMPLGRDIFPQVTETPRADEPNWIVRGGITTLQQLQAGTREHLSVAGLYGFSVQYYPGKTIEELASAGRFPNKQISFCTDADLIFAAARAGYTIDIIKSPGRGYHHTVQVPDPLPRDLGEALRRSFIQMPNPAVFGRP